MTANDLVLVVLRAVDKTHPTRSVARSRKPQNRLFVLVDDDDDRRDDDVNARRRLYTRAHTRRASRAMRRTLIATIVVRRAASEKDRAHRRGARGHAVVDTLVARHPYGRHPRWIPLMRSPFPSKPMGRGIDIDIDVDRFDRFDR